MTPPAVPHRFTRTFEVPGSPEQVWQAIATAEGISAWMAPARLEPHEGGAVAFWMGPDATSEGRVTAYEPAHRFAYEEDWASLVGRDGAPVTPLATEFLVEATSGGTCVVRVVTSAFGTGADWEGEFFEEMETGWAPMLDNLRLYLTLFPGQRATSLWAEATCAATPEEAIAAVRRALAAHEVGDPTRVNGTAGRVERVVPQHVLVRLAEPVPGFLSWYSFGADGRSAVHLQGHLFSEAAPAYVEREEASWRAWLDDVVARLPARGGAPA